MEVEAWLSERTGSESEGCELGGEGTMFREEGATRVTGVRL